MKKIWVFRHGPKKTGSSKGGAVGLSIPLSDEGVEVVSQIASDFIEENGKPKMLFTSPFVRAYQTAMILTEVCKIDPPKIVRKLAGEYQEWDKIVRSVEKKNPTAFDFYEVHPEFVRGEAESFLGAIQGIAQDLNDNENAVCVSHGGLIEPVISLAMLKVLKLDDRDLSIYFPDDLKEGEAIIFTFEGNNNLIAVEMQKRQ